MENNYAYNLRDAEFKDESPLKTVENIKNILKTYNIKTTEKWNETHVPYCFSLRVSVEGTTFGTNGKGITKEFALASAYGELMERIQLGYIGSVEVQKDGDFSVNDVQNEVVPMSRLLQRNIKWYELLADKLYVSTKEKVDAEKILEQYSDAEGNVIVTPFYCVNTKHWEHLPTVLRKTVYSANGCAAGNTPEEAIVQAIGEIVERHSLVEMTFKDITPPDIPENVLQKCSVAYNIISYLRGQGFRVMVKDCSLGRNFPVISICIIDPKTGKYHTHFAAAPVFEIALERALTESFQGRNIESIAEFSDFKYKGAEHFDFENLMRELIKGASEKLPHFFVGEPSYQFDASLGFNGQNNRELLVECISFLTEQGYDVLIRDCSCLGFPTYQVIVPGYSEVWCHRVSQKQNDLKHRKYAVKTLRNPTIATLDEKLGFMMYLPKTKLRFTEIALLPANVNPIEENYMMLSTIAYINYSMMRFSEVSKHIDAMCKNSSCKNLEYLICLKRYINLLVNKYDLDEIKTLLCYFHSAETVDKLYGYINKNANPFEEFVLHCDLKCSENCMLYSKCCKKNTMELSKVIQEKTKELDACASVNIIDGLLS